jgi:hypothetical protein
MKDKRPVLKEWMQPEGRQLVLEVASRVDVTHVMPPQRRSKAVPQIRAAIVTKGWTGERCLARRKRIPEARLQALVGVVWMFGLLRTLHLGGQKKRWISRIDAGLRVASMDVERPMTSQASPQATRPTVDTYGVRVGNY